MIDIIVSYNLDLKKQQLYVAICQHQDIECGIQYDIPLNKIKIEDGHTAISTCTTWVFECLTTYIENYVSQFDQIAVRTLFKDHHGNIDIYPLCKQHIDNIYSGKANELPPITSNEKLQCLVFVSGGNAAFPKRPNNKKGDFVVLRDMIYDNDDVLEMHMQLINKLGTRCRTLQRDYNLLNDKLNQILESAE